MWTKQRKLYAGILAVAAGALLLDRFVLSDAGGAATAEAAAPVAIPRTDKAARTPATSQPSEQRADVADLLEEVAQREGADGQQAGDVFKPAKAWNIPDAAAGTKNETPQRPDVVQSFTNAHTLMAVMVNPRGSVAIIDGERMRVGESIAGWKLVSLAERSAVFTADGLTAELRLETTPMGKVGRRVITTQGAGGE